MAKKPIHWEAVCLTCPTAFGFESDLTRAEVEDRADWHQVVSGHHAVVYEGIGSLKDELKGAKVVEYDEDNNIIFAWFGGHGIYVYAPNGEALDILNAGSFRKADATHAEVHKAIESAKIHMRKERKLS